MTSTSTIHPDLVPHWLVSALFFALLVVYAVVCHVWPDAIKFNVEESQRVFIRSLFYTIAIVLFPLVKLVRHVLLRLNCTMPGDKAAKRRYLTTELVCLMLIEIVGVFGFIMFSLGDGFNSLYIFSGLAALGIFLHKPNLNEYRAICEALHGRSEG